MSSIWTGVPEVESKLPELQQTLLSLAEGEKGALKDLLEEQFSRKGKYLRGGFCLLAGSITGKNPDALMKAAAALEAFHLATLIHDDILDSAEMRRGRPSAHKLYGLKEAVLLGDYLYSRALLLVAPLLEGQNEMELVKGIMHICRQEISQTLAREINWSPREYYRRAGGKTAALFSLSLYTGAHIAEAPSPVLQSMKRYGYNLGLAFQIIDDIIDIKPSGPTGKPLYQDLRNGVSTLPLVLAVQQLPEKKAQAEKALKKGRKRTLLQIIQNGSGLEQARRKAKQYTDYCFKELENLPKVDSLSSFDTITRRCLLRDY